MYDIPYSGSYYGTPNNYENIDGDQNSNLTYDNQYGGYYQTDSNNFNEYYNDMSPTEGYFRFLHASPDAPAVDVYANDKIVARNLRYRGFTEYMNITPGAYVFNVYPAGKKGKPVVSSSILIAGRTIQTIAIAGFIKDLSILPYNEPPIPKLPGLLHLKFVHLSPDAPNVDLTLPNGYILFNNIAFKQGTKYRVLRPGTYAMELRPTGTDKVVLYVPNIVLKPNRFYTVYAIGLASGKPELQFLIPLDGNSYIIV